MSQLASTFNFHRLLAIIALVVALLLLLLWLVSPSLLPFEKALLFLLFDYIIWQAAAAALP